MDAVFKQRGDAIDYIPSTDVPAGTVVVQNDLVGITKLDIPANVRGALAVTGVFPTKKATGAGTAIDAGIKLYWNDAAKVATPDADDGGSPAVPYPYMGKSIAAAGDDDETVELRLEQ